MIYLVNIIKSNLRIEYKKTGLCQNICLLIYAKGNIKCSHAKYNIAREIISLCYKKYCFYIYII